MAPDRWTRAVRRSIRTTRSWAGASSRSGKELWIERDDFEEMPPKGFFRLFPGNKVRLKYGHVIECTGADEGCVGRGHRSAGEAGAGHEERHAGQRCGQGEGRDHLGGRGAMR